MKPRQPSANDSPRRVDWGEVQRRLNSAQQALEQGAEPDANTVARVLSDRAQALAQSAAPAPADEVIDVIEFRLANECYGLEFAYVREVFPLSSLTALPGTPQFVLGIENVRGEIVSVVDLHRFFELPQPGLCDRNKLIILHSEAMAFGVLADAVTGVRSVSRSALQPSLPTLTGVREEYLLGVTGEPLIVLDAARLLADPRLVVEETVQ